MSDLARKMERAREAVEVRWSDERARLVERSMVRRGRRRQAVRRASGVALALTLVAGGGFVLRRSMVSPTVNAPIVAMQQPTPQSIRLADGSRADGLDLASVLATRVATADRTVIAVERGGGRFAVTKNPGRTFRVEAREVAVETLGTEFTVELVDAKVRVGVSEGRVKVMWSDQVVEVGAGESGLYPKDAPVAALVEPSVDEEPAPLVRAPAMKPRRVTEAPAPAAPLAASPSWRALADQGDYEKAYAALQESPPRDEPEDLFKASDVARYSHHAGAAIAPLRQIVRDHRDDPRAPEAAFTLGRVLLNELGRPREAASSFADVRAIDPRSPLGDDALFREVEAWSRAGETERAREQASEYLREFPHGVHVKAVRAIGGIDQ